MKLEAEYLEPRDLSGIEGIPVTEGFHCTFKDRVSHQTKLLLYSGMNFVSYSHSFFVICWGKGHNSTTLSCS